MKDFKAGNNNKETESYIGIDVSKEKLDICLLLLNKDNVYEVHQKVIDNNEAGYKKLLVDINKHKLQQCHLHICMETTGKYHMRVAEYLYSKGLK